MKVSTCRRPLGLLAVLLASQLLSACVILPVPYFPRRVMVVEPGPGHAGPPARDGYDRRGWGR
jgi:hypothetical protein